MLVRQRAASACDPGSRISFRGTTNVVKNLDLAASVLGTEKRSALGMGVCLRRTRLG